jgi:hypothetical protein
MKDLDRHRRRRDSRRSLIVRCRRNCPSDARRCRRVIGVLEGEVVVGEESRVEDGLVDLSDGADSEGFLAEFVEDLGEGEPEGFRDDVFGVAE